MDRATLERRAQELGLPWSQATTEDELVALIRRAELEGTAAVTKRKLPTCHGLFWDAIDAKQCHTCGDQETCFPLTAIRAVQEVLDSDFGGDEETDPGPLSQAMGCGLAAMEALLEYRRAHPDLVKAGGGKPPEAPPPEPEQPALQLTPEPEKPKKKAPPKKAKKEAKAGAAARPTPAGSAEPAAGPAKKRSRKGRRHAGVAEEREGEWTLATYADRYKRERERVPLIGLLVPGMKLVREWKGLEHVVEVRTNGYWYDGRLWPTLYKVTEHIAGTTERAKQRKNGKRPTGTRRVCNWSAARFWSLESQLRRLRETEEWTSSSI